MKSIYLSKNKFIFSNLFAKIIINDPVIFVDIGARGDLDHPWKDIRSEHLKVIGFEPDEKECIRLNQLMRNNMYFPKLLWSSITSKKLYVTADPYCSSVYLPNWEYIKKYEYQHWKPRLVKKQVVYQTDTLDNIVNESKLDCDFIKIDTQGSELEILKGSLKTLRQDVAGVIIETWVSEAYKGQGFTWEVLDLMNQLGFELFDINTAAAWRKNNGAQKTYYKQKIIGLDLFFLKRDSFYPRGKKGFIKLVKTIALAEVFGYPDHAIYLIDKNLKRYKSYAEILEQIKREIFMNASLLCRLRFELMKAIGNIFFIKIHDVPSLHY